MNLITRSDDERLVKESEYRPLGTEHPAPHWLLVDSIRAVIAERDALADGIGLLHKRISALTADLAAANAQLVEVEKENTVLQSCIRKYGADVGTMNALFAAEEQLAEKEKQVCWMQSEVEKHDKMKRDSVKLGLMAVYHPCECRMCRALTSHAAPAARGGK